MKKYSANNQSEYQNHLSDCIKSRIYRKANLQYLWWKNLTYLYIFINYHQRFNHFHIWYIEIKDVIVPKIPTIFPSTDPGFTNEYAIGVSQTTLTVSSIMALLAFPSRLINNIFLIIYVKQHKSQPRALK